MCLLKQQIVIVYKLINKGNYSLMFKRKLNPWMELKFTFPYQYVFKRSNNNNIHNVLVYNLIWNFIMLTPTVCSKK